MTSKGFASTTVTLLLVLSGCGGSSPTPQSGQNVAPPTTAPATPNAPDVKPEPAAEAPKPAPDPEPIVIPAGTSVRVRTTSEISTKTAKAGERFDASLDAPLVVGGRTVAPRGARAELVVASSDPGGRVKGVASIAVRLAAVSLGGRMTPAESGIFRVQAKTTTKKDAMKVGIGSGIGAAIGAIAGGGRGAAIGAASGAGGGGGVVLATRGDPAVIRAESVLAFKLRRPVAVD